MRRLILTAMLWLLLWLPASADGPYELRFPLIEPLPYRCGEVGTEMGYWKVVVNAVTRNRVLNPSAETTANFAALAGTTVTRDTAQQHYGLYSYLVDSNADNEGMTLTLSALPNSDHWVTMRATGSLPPAWDWSLDNATYTEPTLLEQLDPSWALYGIEFPAAQANGSTTLYIRQKGAGSGLFNIDGVQVEGNNDTYTTYCDGTQEGCEWEGTPHASTSTRTENSRAGGIVYDLEDDYGLRIGGMSGSGTSPQELFVDSYSQLPGGELNAIKTNSRVITLTGVIEDTSWAEFHAKKQALKGILSKDALPQDQNGYQPVRLRYTGATVHKEIAVHYETGLEGEIVATEPCFWERVAVRFIAPNPYWYEIGESAALLDTNDSDTFRVIAARLRSTGQWDSLGPPHASGTYGSVRAIVEDATYVYIGGDFQNWNNVAASDYIVRYNKQTGAYSALDVGLNGIVRALALAPNGNLYIGGEFTNAGGVAAADYLTVWDGSAFAAVGVPNTGAASIGRVRALTFDPNGNLYIGGDFSNWADVAAADNLALWDGSAYSAVGTGTDGQVNALIYANSLLYVGGNFSTPYDNIYTWDGSTAADLGGASDSINTFALTPDGILYIGGNYTTIAGVAANRISSWNGTTATPLGTGVNGQVNAVALGSDGVLWLGGLFTSASGLTLTDKLARFNGYAFGHLDVDLPGTPNVFSMLASNRTDPVIPQKYDFFVGFDTTGTGAYAGIADASNGGSVPAFPKIIFTRSGGTGATIRSVKNERNGQEILFNYALQNGETLTVDLSSTRKSISSSFFGPRQDAKLANSDFGDWQLLPGENDITAFVTESGSPTITTYLLWRDLYDSQD